MSSFAGRAVAQPPCLPRGRSRHGPPQSELRAVVASPTEQPRTSLDRYLSVETLSFLA